MELASRADIGLAHRAIREGWNVDKPSIVAALMKALREPDLMMEAAKVLLVADALDLKREKMEAKAKEAEEAYRSRLMGVLRRIPEPELRAMLKASGIDGIPEDGPLFPSA
jgi:hypothetical protein